MDLFLLWVEGAWGSVLTFNFVKSTGLLKLSVQRVWSWEITNIVGTVSYSHRMSSNSFVSPCSIAKISNETTSEWHIGWTKDWEQSWDRLEFSKKKALGSVAIQIAHACPEDALHWPGCIQHSQCCFGPITSCDFIDLYNIIRRFWTKIFQMVKIIHYRTKGNTHSIWTLWAYSPPHWGQSLLRQIRGSQRKSDVERMSFGGAVYAGEISKNTNFA